VSAGVEAAAAAHPRRGYRCLLGDPYRYGRYTLTAPSESDAEQIRGWRNAQRDVLRQSVVLSAEDQRRYFRLQVFPELQEREPRQILLTLLEDGAAIGYTGLTHLDWQARRAELSFLVEPARAADPIRYARDFSHCLTMLCAIAFGELGLNRLFTETFDVRPAHVALLEAQGFQREGRLRQHAWVDGALVDSLMHGLTREDWNAGR
jgi:RimJ/RimL family protein N-acetyltransferase